MMKSSTKPSTDLPIDKSMLVFLLLLSIIPFSSSSSLRIKADIDTSSVAEYLKSNVNFIKENAELSINRIRDKQGRIGPISMPSVLLGDMIGDLSELPKTSGVPSRLEPKMILAVIDPTAGSEESVENKDPTTTVEVIIPVDVRADMSLMIDAAGMHVTTAYFQGKPQLLTEINSGAQDAPRSMEEKEGQPVVDTLVNHVNEFRSEKCPTLQKLNKCSTFKDAAVIGWVVDAGPGQESFVTAVDCQGIQFVGAIDLPRTGGIENGLFGGTIPGPCSIGVTLTPPHLLPSPNTINPTSFLDIEMSEAAKKNFDLVKERVQGDRETFLSKSRFAKVPLVAGTSKFNEEEVKKLLPPSFDPRINDHPNFSGSSTGCYQAPNRIRNQRSCMSCWAFASASVFTDRQCLATLKQYNKKMEGGDLPPPILYSPASALACRRPPTCLLGGFTNFVSMLSSGITSETCFPYKLKTDGAARYKPETGEMFTDSDVVPNCPMKEYGGLGKCPGETTREYYTEDVSGYGVYRIHNKPDALRKAIYDGGPVTAAISWGATDGHHFTNYGAGGPACGTEGAKEEGVCSKFDPKKGKDDPIVLLGRSKLPADQMKDGGHAAGHAIEIIGWECSNHPICDEGSWLIQNSWGHSWGEDGIGHISFNSMDIENQIYFIDVAGVYDDKVMDNTGVKAGKASSINGEDSDSSSKAPPDVILKANGITHDHGGSLFYIKAISGGHIAEKQNEGAFGVNSIVVSLKWKLTQGGICKVNTINPLGKSVQCPVEGGKDSWDTSLDLTGCTLVDNEKGMIAIGKCEDNAGENYCQVSHSATPENNPSDPMEMKGKTGLVTETKMNNFLQEKFLVNIVLKNIKGSHFKINIRCSLTSDPKQTSEQTVEIDPTPTTEVCSSETLKAFGTCKQFTFFEQGGIDGKPMYLANKNIKKNTGASKMMVSPQEQLKKNEDQAKQEAEAEGKMVDEEIAETVSENDECPVKKLANVKSSDELSDDAALKELEEMKLTDEEKKILVGSGHDKAWKDCSPQQRIAMVTKFRDAIKEMGI
jgi:hypothetical protein